MAFAVDTERNILKCKYCDKTTMVQSDITSLLLLPKNSKDGGVICKKYGHVYIYSKTVEV